MENTPPPPLGGEYQAMSFGGKNMKREREKGGKCKRKGRNRKKKVERGKKMRKGKKRGKRNAK